MTADTGMDVSPSWQDLKDERDSWRQVAERLESERQAAVVESDDWEQLANRYQNERDALAAHVERLNDKLGDIKDSLYERNLHVVGWHLNGDTEPMDAWFEENDWEPEPCDCTSLDRLKAQWLKSIKQQSRRVRNYSAPNDIFGAVPISAIEAELRRQAEEGK